MNEYDFTLTFTIPNPEERDRYVEKLYEANCDDALIGIGKTGSIALNFIREKETAYQAIYSAIHDVREIIPEAIFLQAEPDLVGMSDLADLIGCTRQNIRKLLTNDSSSPSPCYSYAFSLWHLADILFWLQESKSYAIDQSLLEVSEVNMKLNISVHQLKTDKNTSTDRAIKDLAKFAVFNQLSIR